MLKMIVLRCSTLIIYTCIHQRSHQGHGGAIFGLGPVLGFAPKKEKNLWVLGGGVRDDYILLTESLYLIVFWSIILEPAYTDVCIILHITNTEIGLEWCSKTNRYINRKCLHRLFRFHLEQKANSASELILTFYVEVPTLYIFKVGAVQMIQYTTLHYIPCRKGFLAMYNFRLLMI